jgi:hypothetical protein
MGVKVADLITPVNVGSFTVGRWTEVPSLAGVRYRVEPIKVVTFGPVT